MHPMMVGKWIVKNNELTTGKIERRSLIVWTINSIVENIFNKQTTTQEMFLCILYIYLFSSIHIRKLVSKKRIWDNQLEYN